MARDILYLDQAAAARPAPEVLDYYRVALERCFANQEAAHSMGYALRRELDLAASELSAALTGSPDRAVVWGNSGTELLALLADSPAAAGRCVLSTPLEHPASGANFRRAAARGGEAMEETLKCLRCGVPLQRKALRTRRNAMDDDSLFAKLRLDLSRLWEKYPRKSPGPK